MKIVAYVLGGLLVLILCIAGFIFSSYGNSLLASYAQNFAEQKAGIRLEFQKFNLNFSSIYAQAMINGEILAEILAGGADKVAECGGVIVGGHTIQTPETYYGLSVTGRVDPRKFWSNNAANEGDALILTKPLGTGVLSTALKADMLDARGIEAAVETMRRLNFDAVRAMEGVSVSAATDVWGI